MRLPSGRAVLGAAFVPVVFTGYLYAMGYDQLFTDVVHTTRSWPVKAVVLLVTYVLPLVVVGAVETATYERGLVLPAVATIVGLFGIPWVVDLSPGFAAVTSFGTEIAVVTAAVLVLAVLEYVVRVRMRVLPPRSDRA